MDTSTFDKQTGHSVELELEDGFLVCPTCGGDCLHQGDVHVVSRPREDGPGNVIAVSNSGVEFERLESIDLPGRRQFLEIDIWCENCDTHECRSAKRLRIQQDKGRTYLYWVEKERK